MNKLKIYSIIVTIILILILGFIGYSYVATKNYQKGFNDGQVNIVQGITNTGRIPIFQNISGNYTIQSFTLNELCQGVIK